MATKYFSKSLTNKPIVPPKYRLRSWTISTIFCTSAFILYDAGKGQAMLATNTKDCFIGFAEVQSIDPYSTCTTFEVENIEQAVQALQQKGVEFNGGIIEIPNAVKLATFFDPDGYKLMLSERIDCNN